MSEHRCKECGIGIAGNQAASRGYCAACRLRYCNHCESPLPAGRKSRQCADCLRKKTHERALRPDRRCYLCQTRLPAGRYCRLCPACHRLLQQDYRRQLARDPGRLCPDCHEPVGEARTSTRCRECHRRHILAVRSRPGRVCSMCGSPNRGRQVYCRSCKALYQNWWGAYHKGDPGARALRPLRPYTRYKEANP